MIQIIKSFTKKGEYAIVNIQPTQDMGFNSFPMSIRETHPESGSDIRLARLFIIWTMSKVFGIIYE